MRESTSNNICARSEDLVTYLYGEATQEESVDFERHIQQCVSCSVELAAFGDLRSAVGDWRQQVLDSIPSPGFQPFSAVAPARGRSAIAALREFFTLSPMWMRAATAVAALIFCALATIAVAYFLQQPQTIVVETPVKTGYSEEEMRARIEAALKRQEELRAATTAAPPSKILEAPGADQSGPATENKERTPQKRQQRALPDNVSQPSEAEVVASSDYLPFTAPGREEKLPSLSDLVDDNEE